MHPAVIICVLAALSLSGCLHNDQVRVGVSNQTDVQQTVDIKVSWIGEGEESVTRLERTVAAAPGEHTRAGTFLRPCENDLVGTLRYEASADNGTQASWDQAWDAGGCVEQSVALRMEADRMAWSAVYAD